MGFIFKILYVLVTFVETLVIFRIVLKIINADVNNSIVSWVYNLSDQLIKPFEGILSESISIDRFTIELTPIVALLFYAIIGFVLSELSKAFKQAD
ncbi:MAG: hypothetical protein UR34_C0005G0019 [candidate division WS6 bacterium GW2011_GWC1_33_20]|uniref:YGGT family protein n=2 Tax=Candidatus Dojkabacteria TaxID=74243 RepID=A0A0G0CVS2_9BACT|nr:MAG: hypothetical protein UR32_C0002G0009 [candidate division WS6 bacterium GW2011_GWE2_33_157]KKP44196.1 MAG: hypothetical protein UR34_C0005G0019 [candidate division WS6 bacterium GW2011_GWC1_33_20]KKP45748.1 MAG: hypothetical protein UR36_C0004G0009 [candidate division WS6 bacterium GW2011_GWF1_33_233]KKP55090.1 MAG: hypothetical protein UR47_C0005G0019 [candidate division WS6 bacterium GW2011_GWB1_33_6]KKP55191.1 MAG: hypothetical protein UR45_C0003G0009 [candidate division WS6 bacterium